MRHAKPTQLISARSRVADLAYDRLHAMQFRLPRCSSSGQRPAKRPLPVTVVVRWIPLVTVACGTWVARPASTTRLAWQRRLPARPEGEARPR
jgi:hypothetical protein